MSEIELTYVREKDLSILKHIGLCKYDDVLRGIRATVRFLSVEPLLEDLGDLDLRDIHWVIVGGESGRRARPMRAEWVERIKRQCDEHQVPFFFKQWGAWSAEGQKRSKKANGRTYAGEVWDAMPV